MWTTQFPNICPVSFFPHKDITTELTYWHRKNVPTCDILFTRRRLHYVNCFAHVNSAFNEIRYSFSSHDSIFLAFLLCISHRRWLRELAVTWKYVERDDVMGATWVVPTVFVGYFDYCYFHSKFDFNAFCGSMTCTSPTIRCASEREFSSWFFIFHCSMLTLIIAFKQFCCRRNNGKRHALLGSLCQPTTTQTIQLSIVIVRNACVYQIASVWSLILIFVRSKFLRMLNNILTNTISCHIKLPSSPVERME